MCGIAGVLYQDRHHAVDHALVARMGKAIAHRGPDGEGFLEEPGIGLVHRRLSIIDLSGGAQPIGNEDGGIQVIFNGEIYNYQSLRRDLLARGHALKTQSDTEVLVHLYEDHGEDMVRLLRGMFTFAIWDRPRRRLFLARDRLGIKPLYYYRDQHKFVFGSEIKAILAHGSIDRRLDAAALEDYLAFGVVPGPRSIFARISKLQPAHTLVVEEHAWNASPKCYWKLSFDPAPVRSIEVWKEQLRAKLQETVRLHLIADVPVGAFLSGGFDSSVIVASTSGATKGDLHTFSMGFHEAAFSELPFAREVALKYGTRHVQEIVTPQAVDLVDELTTYYDEPFADSSAIPTYLVSRLASRHVKVVLSGDGGDEAFGGYARYAHDLHESKLRDRIPSWLRHGVIGPLAGVWPKADWLPRPLRAKTRLTNLSLSPGDAYANTLMLCRQPLRRQLLHPAIRANGHHPAQAVLEHHRGAEASDPLAGMMAADIGTLLPDDFLVKVDRASMANGLEVRPPLLDHELMELAASMPSELKVHEGETKWIFKETFRDLLPASLHNRPKQGFEIPIDDWLRGPLRNMVHDTVLAKGSPVAALINQDTAAKLMRSHERGTGRHGSVIWSVLMLAHWTHRYCPSV